ALAAALALVLLPAGASTADAKTPSEPHITSRAGSPAALGWVWASRPTTASYTPVSNYSYNSEGQMNRVERRDVGLYTVTFPELRRDDFEVQVTAYGNGTVFCNLDGNYNNGTSGLGGDLEVHVHCLDEDDLAETDSRFVVSLQGQDGPSSLDGAGVRIGMNAGWDGWNSSGGDFTVDQLGQGVYDVYIEDQTAVGSNVQVTGVGTRPFGAWCNVAWWNQAGPDVRVRVMCWSVQWPTNARFHLRFSSQQSTTLAYAWADRPTSRSYTPHRSYQWQGPSGSTTGAVGGSYGVGSEFVRFPDVSGTPSTAMVTAYGSGLHRCAIASWGSTPMDVRVRCRHAVDLNPVDTRFTVWARTGPRRLGPVITLPPVITTEARG
ncbi:MAG: hypothetical protein AAFP84_21750, partial [Actinomycetota bacterium]